MKPLKFETVSFVVGSCTVGGGRSIAGSVVSGSNNAIGGRCHWLVPLGDAIRHVGIDHSTKR